MSSWKKTLTMAALLGAFGGHGLAFAEGGATETNYRCEAAKVRADSRELGCKGLCQRRSLAKAAEARADWRASCENDCHLRCEEQKGRIDNGPLCRDVPTSPDPDRCAAKLLGTLAQLEFCISNCPEEEVAMFTDLAEDRVPRSATCRTRCNQNQADAEQHIRALDVCREGKFPVCVYQ